MYETARVWINRLRSFVKDAKGREAELATSSHATFISSVIISLGVYSLLNAYYFIDIFHCVYSQGNLLNTYCYLNSNYYVWTSGQENGSGLSTFQFRVEDQQRRLDGDAVHRLESWTTGFPQLDRTLRRVVESWIVCLE